MAIRRDLVGHTYPAGEPYEVAREKIREFADAIGDPNPAYRDLEAARELGYPDVVAPPTFPAIVSVRLSGQVLSEPELNPSGSGAVVHTQQSFSYTRPVYAGDVLLGTVTISDVRSAGSNELVSTTVDLQTPQGEHVCTAQATLLVRGGSTSG